jgi:23S rRNA pseudouridine2605 synthase
VQFLAKKFKLNSITIFFGAISRFPDSKMSTVWLSRVDKLLAHRGCGTRSYVQQLIQSGQVTRSDKSLVRSPKERIPERERLFVKGVEVVQPPILIAYYKPVGVHCVMSDPLGRSCLKEIRPSGLVGEAVWNQYHPVGRLDADSSGLLFFSANGQVTNRILHPKFKVEREYEAVVDISKILELAGGNDLQKVNMEIHNVMNLLEKGVDTRFSGIHCAKYVEYMGNVNLEEKTAVVNVVVEEGKYRMVRRMLANGGLPVLALNRTRIGPVSLSALSLSNPGDWAEVKSNHLIRLWKHLKNVANPRGV